MTATTFDERVLSGLREQLTGWRAELQGGAERLGWKIGLNVPEIQRQIGIDTPVIGNLTSASRIEPGGRFPASGTARLHAETEIAVELGKDVAGGVDADTARDAIAGFAPAIELVDLDRPPDDLQSVIAANIFHRGVVLGESRAVLPRGVVARIAVGGAERGTADAPGDFADVVILTAELLAAVGERLEAGDRIIAGAIVPPVPVRPADEVSVDFGELGTLGVRITD